MAGSGIYPGHQDGPGSSARFNFPKGISLDAENNIYVADRLNFVVRKIDTSYNVTTIAGIVGQSDLINGPLAEGAIGRPVYATPFQDGNLLISDWVNDVMRIVDFDGVITSTIALVDVNVKVSPNPSASLFYIDSPEQVEAYSIYDSRMQLIKQEAKLNLHSLQIDLSAYLSGVFILRLKLPEGIVTKKKFKG